MKIFIICSFIMPILALDFSIDISPIIYENCTSCHREGQIASFLPLENYEDVFINRFWIAYAIEGSEDIRHGEPIMPPWPPDREYSTLLDEMYLSESEVHTFIEWVDGGALQGNPQEEYLMPDFPEGSKVI